ncbi:MAG TPA: histidine--tRNA ligase [Gemmatimonadota bacterium]|nr:histidine--tRNA ligase [Gemmatimonadota bacterium]
MSRLDRLPGTRDFYPREMRVRRWIEARWREVALRYGFQEYDGPILEPLELFTEKSGAEIERQLYAFEDRGGRHVALRPEMTPSLARMIAARSQGLPKPVKWFSIPRLFRYERPQRGRFREFWQLNLDILGIEGVEADAEIIAAGVDVLKGCGLTAEDFEVRYSDRRLLDAVLGELGVGEPRRQPVYAALDRLLRAGPEVVVAELQKAGLPASTAEALTRAVARRELAGLEALLPGGAARLEREVERIGRLAAYLDAYGIGQLCVFDAAVVRGLAYYTGVVFEMYDRAGELRALCGGGRFDDLLGAVGGENLPAVGFGLGEAVLLELLAARGRLPDSEPTCDAFVVPVSAADREGAIAAAAGLRSGGLAADLALRDQSVGKGLRAAAQAGARVAIVVGERERASGRFTVRDLDTGEELALPLADIIQRLSDGRRTAARPEE